MDTKKTAEYIGLGLVVLIAYKAAKALNLFGNPNAELNDSVDNNPLNFWSPTAWQTLGWSQSKQDDVYSVALPVAKVLKHDVFGYFSDSFPIAFAAIKRMKTQSEVSFLCDVFQYEYNLDLYTWLRNGNWTPASGLSEAHLAQINKYILKLPKN